MRSEETGAGVRGSGFGRAGCAVGLGICAAIFLATASLRGREAPPSAPPPKPVALPSAAVRILPNGLKVVVIERHSLPLLTLRLEVKAGAEADPPRLLGTAQMVAGLLDEGTTRRSAKQIAEAVDQVGGTVQTGAEWDVSFAELTVLTDHTELAFDLLSDMIIRPAFEPAEVERIRTQTVSALKVVRDDPAYLADTVFRQVVFSGTAYGHPEDGSLEAVERLTPARLREFHARYYQPGNSTLAVVGDISPQKGFEEAEKYLGAWQGVSVDRGNARPYLSSRSRQVVIIDKPDAVQTEIRIGNMGIRRDSPDYYPLSVANQILGGPAANRLFRVLRSREGLTYGASSELLCYRALGGWVAKTFTRTSETIKSVQVALEQMKRLRNRPISEDELATAKDYLIGHQALEFETSEGVATQILDLMLHDLPLDYWNRFPERVEALRTNDVWEATRRYLDPEASVIVLVGNLAGFRKELKQLGPLRIIPWSSLDFEWESLERRNGKESDRQR